MLAPPPPTVEIAAVVMGATSGGLHAVEQRTDAIGTFTLALVTGLGGGMLSDLLIGDGPPRALRAPLYLPAVAVVALVVLLFASWLARVRPALMVVDALLLGLFAVTGADRAVAHHLPAGAVLFLGTVTATGGSVLRDLLSGASPAMLRRGDLYATAALAASLVFLALARSHLLSDEPAHLVAVAAGALVRLLAIRWHIKAPEPFDVPRWWASRSSRPRKP